MSKSKQEVEGVPSSNNTQSEEDEIQTSHERSKEKGKYSPTPSVVSLKSDQSMGHPLVFKRNEQKSKESPAPSGVSMKSVQSMGHPLVFKRDEQESKESPAPSGVSMKSDQSMGHPLVFKRDEQESKESPAPSGVSMKSDQSMGHPLVFKRQDPTSKVHEEPSEDFSGSKTDLASIFKVLEENIVAFVKDELKKYEKVLNADYPECSGGQNREEEMTDEQSWSSREAFLKVTQEFMRRMKLEDLAILLQNRTLAPVCRCKLKSSLKQKFQNFFDGIPEAGYPTLLNQMYTEVHITEGGTSEVNYEHEIRQIETASRKQDRPETTIQCKDIFKVFSRPDKRIRIVMTKGVAGIGKTVLTQKYTLDWAEGKANQEMQFTFPFTFRELNVLKEKMFSLVELVQHFFLDVKESGICRFQEFQVLFIFDGLDECRLPLDFQNNEILTDVKAPASVDVLLTSLIRGALLPSAHIWITTRPAAANQIPRKCIDIVTEVRGFTDEQKDEYFQKRFRDEEQASRIIAHVKTSPGLHIMCHIPVFCWITATVLEDVLITREGPTLPKTFTELFSYFLVVQSKIARIKYDDGGAEGDPNWSPESKEMILSLGKLAFEQLQEGNLIFEESDLMECGIDIRAASVYSGVFTQVFKEERGLYKNRVFCFVHLSVQEFLAALYVHLTFFKSGGNLLSEEKTSLWSKLVGVSPETFYKSAVDKAIQSPNGHLDLFLRFLLGLSVQTNQSILKGLVTETRNSSQINQQTAQYIKKRMNESISLERSMNLLHCLNEVKDSSLVEEIQQSLSSGSLSADKLSPAQWSALVFILLSSEENLDEFDLTKYSASEEALLRLLPVVKASTKALLSGCSLSKRSCEALSSILSSPSSNLKELDMSNNDLRDSGLKSLCAGLESPHCTLEVLRLSGCLITKKGCASLFSALWSSSSNLKELDLSYNNPGNSGVKLLSGLQKLQTLRVDHEGSQSMKPGLRKYSCELTLDLNTGSRNVIVSENNRKLSVVREKQPYPEDPQRFSYWKQLLCKNRLTGRCYWEVEWTGNVYIAVTYEGIKRKGEGDDSCLGRNDQSWSLSCSDDGYSVLIRNSKKPIPVPVSNRVGVYLDWPAGTLSFYKISSDEMTHLYTIKTTFREPVYPAFRIKMDPFKSTVFLCQI
nr:NLR family CARD domain-containing protein 3-like isoform X1 [Labrus bergylta]XP_029137544.1 NLR family CARD domain-containing protein 3-like isoform X1 [Labrus bergylta]